MFTKLKGQSVEELATSLASTENTLDAQVEAKKKNLREEFLNKVKNIFQTKSENVKLLDQSLEKIKEKRSSEQEELEAAQKKIIEIEGEDV